MVTQQMVIWIIFTDCFLNLIPIFRCIIEHNIILIRHAPPDTWYCGETAPVSKSPLSDRSMFPVDVPMHRSLFQKADIYFHPDIQNDFLLPLPFHDFLFPYRFQVLLFQQRRLLSKCILPLSAEENVLYMYYFRHKNLLQSISSLRM